MIDDAATFLKQQEEGRRGAQPLRRAGMRADADFMIWTHAERIEDLQAAYPVSGAPCWGGCPSRCGVPRRCTVPPSSTKSHLPAFIAGEIAGDYVCVYPFVRSLEVVPAARGRAAASARRARHGRP